MADGQEFEEVAKGRCDRWVEGMGDERVAKSRYERGLEATGTKARS